MFEKLRVKFAEVTQTGQQYKHTHPKFAAVALLTHVMAVDGHIDPREVKLLHDIVSQKIATSEIETLALIAQAQRDEKYGFDFNIYVDTLKKNLDRPSLHTIIHEMLQIMLADEKIRETEVGYILRVAEMLGLSPEETNIIYRQAVETV